MIPSRIDAAMNALLLVVVILLSSAVYSDEQMPIVDKGSDAKSQIEGEDIDVINLVFNDFLRDKSNEYVFSVSDALRKIKYYTFILEKKDNTIFVHVVFDFVRLKDELDLTFKGGDVRYEIDRRDLSIRKKLHYK